MLKREPFPSADEIAARAHELFMSDGRRVAKIPEYWRAAERELLEQAANRVIHADVRRPTRAPDGRRTARRQRP